MGVENIDLGKLQKDLMPLTGEERTFWLKEALERSGVVVVEDRNSRTDIVINYQKPDSGYYNVPRRGNPSSRKHVMKRRRPNKSWRRGHWFSGHTPDGALRINESVDD